MFTAVNIANPNFETKIEPVNDNRQVNDLMKTKTSICFKLFHLFALKRIIWHERNND